jgi:myosin heavy subunit
MGILALLDDELAVPKADDLSFVKKLHGAFGTKPRLHPCYRQVLKNQTDFAVVHYAGAVVYSV